MGAAEQDGEPQSLDERLTRARQGWRARPDDDDALDELWCCLREAAFEYDPEAQRDPQPDTRYEHALASSWEAIQIGRRLAEEYPDSAHVLACLFWSLHGYAHVCESRTPREAVAAYWEAAVVGQRRLAVDEDPDGVRQELSWTLRDAASLTTGDPAEAQSLIEQAVVLARTHLGRRPDDAEALRELGSVLTVAGAFAADRQPGRALSLYREAVALAQRVVHAQPDEPGGWDDLWLALVGVADLLVDTDPEAAMAMYEHAEEIAARFPEDPVR